MKGVLITILFTCFVSVLPSHAITPVYAHSQEQPSSKLSRVRAALLKLNPVHAPSRTRQFMIVDHWGGEPETTLPNGALGTNGNSLSTGAKAGVGIGIAVGVLWFAQLLGLIPDP